MAWQIINTCLSETYGARRSLHEFSLKEAILDINDEGEGRGIQRKSQKIGSWPTFVGLCPHPRITPAYTSQKFAGQQSNCFAFQLHDTHGLSAFSIIASLIKATYALCWIDSSRDVANVVRVSAHARGGFYSLYILTRTPLRRGIRLEISIIFSAVADLTDGYTLNRFTWLEVN